MDVAFQPTQRRLRFAQFEGGLFYVVTDVSNDLSDAVVSAIKGVEQMSGKNAVLAIVPFVGGLTLFAGIENRNVRLKFRLNFFSS